MDMSTSAVFALKVVPRAGGAAGRLRPRGKVGRTLRAPGGPQVTGGPQRGPCTGWRLCPWARAAGGRVGPHLQVDREIALHSRLKHRNIVALHGHFADRENVYMVLEYCSRQVRGMGAEGAGMPLSAAPPPRLLCSPDSLYLPVSTRVHTRPICAHP